MNEKKEINKAGEWLSQVPSPRELSNTDIHNVLEGLGFESLGKISADTATRWRHACLNQSPYFGMGTMKISVGHKKGAKTMVRRGTVNDLLRALELYFGDEL